MKAYERDLRGGFATLSSHQFELLFLRNKSAHKQAPISCGWVIFVHMNFDGAVHYRVWKLMQYWIISTTLFLQPLIATFWDRFWFLHCTCEISVLWVCLFPWDLTQVVAWRLYGYTCRDNIILHLPFFTLLLSPLSQIRHSVMTPSLPQYNFCVYASLRNSQSLLLFHHTPFSVKEMRRKALNTKSLWTRRTPSELHWLWGIHFLKLFGWVY